MTDYAGTFVFYEAWSKNALALARPTDSFEMLLTSPAHTPNAAAHALLADIDNEVSGNGYARQALGSVTFDRTGNVTTFDFADPMFMASGGPWTAKYWHVVDVTAAGSPLVAYGRIDASVDDVVVTSGNRLKLFVDPLGFFDVVALAP